MKEITYDAAGGEGRIFARILSPDKPEVKAVVQIAHGMAEHSLRYLDFAHFLTSHGYVVCINDHAGHGRSVPSGGGYGYFGQGGYHSLLKDMNTLRGIVQDEYPDAPYIMMGHSMGSFLARAYLTQYGQGVAAAIFSGTSGGMNRLVMKAGRAIAQGIVRKKGPKAYDKRLQNLVSGSFNDRFKPARTENDWLTRDEKVVDLFNADPLCGFMFTASAYYTLICLLDDINTPAWFRAVPQIPILLFSGEQDPVGDFGRGVRRVAHRLETAGRQVECKLYPGGRHEMLNELNREEVYHDVLAFIEKALQQPEEE